MTELGGTKSYGTIFSIDTNGTGYKNLLNFNSTNGTYPTGSLILSGGKLYGMARLGGAIGYGCVFSIDTDGNNYKDLLDFNVTNGANPWRSSLTISGNKNSLG